MAANINIQDLQNAIANGITTGFQNQPAQPAQPRDKKPVTAKPETFSGNTTDYEKFKRQAALYILANQSLFPDDDAKILFILSYVMTASLFFYLSYFHSLFLYFSARPNSQTKRAHL